MRVIVDRPLQIALISGWAVALTLGAWSTARGQRLITLIGLVACAGQPLAGAATALELTHHVSHRQVEKLHALGVNPRGSGSPSTSSTPSARALPQPAL